MSKRIVDDTVRSFIQVYSAEIPHSRTDGRVLRDREEDGISFEAWRAIVDIDHIKFDVDYVTLWIGCAAVYSLDLKCVLGCQFTIDLTSREENTRRFVDVKRVVNISA